MYDRHNRKIDYLRLSVTDNCNLNCFYCMPESKKRTKELPDEMILKIVEAAVQKGIKKIRITGGEPLIRKGIYNLLKQIKEVKGIEELTITTNGTLLFNNVHKLKESGVDRINLSIDSLHKKDYQSITKSNEDYDFYKLIGDLIEEGITPVKVNVVLLKGVNNHQVDAYIELMDHFDISIRFIELMEIGDMEYDYNNYFMEAHDLINTIPNLINKQIEGNTTYYNIKNKLGRIGFINPISNKFCGSCNRIRVTSDGNIRPCLHFDTEIKIDDIKKIDKDIEEAISLKPKEHHLEQGKHSKTPMNKIGG